MPRPVIGTIVRFGSYIQIRLQVIIISRKIDMRVALIISLIIAVAAVIFAIQNPGTIELVLGPYTMLVSTALVIIVTFGAGLLVGMLAGLPGRMRSRRRIRMLEHPPHEEETLDYRADSGPGYAEPYDRGRHDP